jgi:hypothetical protein
VRKARSGWGDHQAAELWVDHDYSVTVDFEVGCECTVSTDIADDCIVAIPADVLVSLTGRLKAQVGNRHPGHEKVDLGRYFVQCVASDGHQIGQRRQSEIAVQSPSEHSDVAAGGWESHAALVRGLTPPIPAAIMVKLKPPTPPLTADLNAEASRDEVLPNVQPVVEPIRQRVNTNLSTYRTQRIRPEVEISDLRPPGIQPAPDQESSHQRIVVGRGATR